MSLFIDAALGLLTMPNTLFQPYYLNDTLTLSNRITMAPLTRCMASDDLVPTDQMVAYYARRADVGLIISEATIIRADGQGFPNTPGLFTQAQIDGWKKVTAAVHDKGGKIFAQLWHLGRQAHSHYFGEGTVYAPSALQIEGTLPRARDFHYEVPKAADKQEIAQLIADYTQAAKNAIEAGFDGVEIHAANGYLIDQFLHFNTNIRDDEYGQTPENMARFALEITDSICAAIGQDRTAIRLSPAAYTHIEIDARDKAVFDYLLMKLSDRNLAYVHAGIFDDSVVYEHLGGKVSEYMRKQFTGHFMAVGGYSAEQAAKHIENNDFDLIAIGRPLIANPDYIEKVKSGKALTQYSADMLGELI